MKEIRGYILPFASLIMLLCAGLAFGQGPIVPPGAPGPTMRSLSEIYDAASSAKASADTAVARAQAALDAAIAAKDSRIAINATNTPPSGPARFTITQPGSYYLTGNIIGQTGKHGILVTTSSVTIDLNGFALMGVPGSMDGIEMGSQMSINNVVRNGTITRWGGDGVDVVNSWSGILEGLTVSENGGNGLAANLGFVIIRCLARDNKRYGYYTMNTGLVFENCTATSNSLDGFLCAGATAANCVARNNGGNGFALSGGATLFQCSSLLSGLAGISASGNSIVTRCFSQYNRGDGISVGSNCDIRDNTCSNNGYMVDGGAGIQVSGMGNRIEGNTFTANDQGLDIDAGGNMIARNAARNNTDNYGQIIAGNSVGPIGTLPAATSPWANLVY